MVNFSNATRKAVFYVAVSLLAAATLAAQDTQEPSPITNRSIPSMVGQVLDHDFVNYYVFGNAVYDDRVPVQTSSIPTASTSSWGYEVGGGVTLAHQFKDGDLSLSYRGDYRAYNSNIFGSGTDQNLSLLFDKRVSRRWTVSLPVSAGIIYYGAAGYAGSAGVGSPVATNPLSPETRFIQAGINATYQMTRRFSFVFSGNFFLNDYNYAAAIGSKGVSGSVTAQYRLSAKTTIGATYSHSYYTYSRNSGLTNVDGESLSLTHDFVNHWQVSVSGGVNRSNSSGTLTIPVAILLGQQVLTGFEIGAYQRVSYTPSFQGTLTHFFKHSSASVSGGQGVIPGNGTYLTSRDQFASGLYSFSTRRANLSFAGGFFHLTSISNSVTQAYTTDNLTVSYGYTLTRYLSANAAYNFLHYGGFFGLGSLNENRITVGLSLSTKGLPLGIF
jgi:hypothetical protein